MNPLEIDHALTRTLADRKLSGGEKRALADALGLADLTEPQRAFLRHRAFALARAEMTSPDGPALLDWLEDVVKLTLPAAEAHAAAPTATAYFSPGHDCVGRIAALFRQARRAVDVCVFTITDDRIARPLLEAHGRGVAVRVLTDDDKSRELGSDVERFRQAGVAVRTDRSPYHMHHKFAVFDGAVLLTGSYNWTRGAAEQNKENFLTTTDPTLIRAYGAAFQRLWDELG